jgi:hypothetical protein
MVVDPKKNNRKKWRAKEEERHKGSLTPKNNFWYFCLPEFLFSFSIKNFDPPPS